MRTVTILEVVRVHFKYHGMCPMQARRQPAPVPAEGGATLGEHERSILAKYAQDDDEDQEQQQQQQQPSEDQDDDDQFD